MSYQSALQNAQKAIELQDWAKAESLYRSVLEDTGDVPSSIIVHVLDQLGLLACECGDHEQGAEYFLQATQVIPEEMAGEETRQLRAGLLYHLGMTQRLLGERREAAESLYLAKELDPKNAETILQLGQLYFELGYRGHTKHCFELLTQLEPENPSNWLTLGYVFSLDGEYEEAVPALETALSLDPQSADICFQLAEALRKLERYEESLPHYQRLLGVAMERPQAVLGYAKSLLPLDRFEEGWDAFEFRRISQFGTWERHQLANWNGSDTSEKTLLVYGEEGVGTEVLFASCLAELVRDAKHCLVECSESLHTLFARSFPGITLLDPPLETIGGDGITEVELGGYRVAEQVAMGDLPNVYRRNRADFPTTAAYLKADPELRRRWKARLDSFHPLPKIGFLWKGRGTAEIDVQNTLPLAPFVPLLRIEPRAAWICLQQGSAQEKLASLRQPGVNIHLFPEVFAYDLEEMAALLSALDLVITPPGLIAHLAAALGTATWMILPKGCDWRWTLGAAPLQEQEQETLWSGTPWHPSMCVFRQERRENWASVFRKVGVALHDLLSKGLAQAEEDPQIFSFESVRNQTFRLRKAG